MFTVRQEAAIRSAIEYECVRQHVGADRQAFLYSAYARAVVLSDLGVPPQPGQVLQLAGERPPKAGASEQAAGAGKTEKQNAPPSHHLSIDGRRSAAQRTS